MMTFAVIEALILAKVIMIGDVVRLGRGLEQKPLIFPTLYKTLVFTLFVAVFTVLEHVIKWALEGDGTPGRFLSSWGKGTMKYSPIVLSFLLLFCHSSASRSWDGCWDRTKYRLSFSKKETAKDSNRGQEMYAMNACRRS